MSDEQLSAARAELIQRYLNLKGRYAILSATTSAWKESFEYLSRQMHRFQNEDIDPKYLRYPSPEEFKDGIEDWNSTLKAMHLALKQMQDAGINLS